MYKLCLVVVSVVFGAVLIPELAVAQLTVVESGFTVTTLPAGVGAKGIECSPGGIWGNFVYVADSSGGTIDRIDFSDNVTTFATGLSFPVGMDFGPGPGGNFGNFIYVANFSDSTIKKVDSSGTVTAFASLLSPGDTKFDPSGAYGNDLLATTAFSAPISKVDSSGSSTVFSTLTSAYLRFGPGGAWGAGLYATDNSASPGIAKVASNGTPTLFSGGFTAPEGFDWASGPGFNGDLFATDITTGEIYRVKSNGTRTLFATLAAAADVAFCNGALYAVSFNGGCYKITASESEPIPALSTPGVTLFLLIATGATFVLLRRRRSGQHA